MLPFSAEDFFAVFADYNQGVWPMQWALHTVAAAILWLSASREVWRDRVSCGLLAGLWAWMALTYHLAYFSRINAAALIFGASFLIEAALLIRWLIAGRVLQLGYRRDFASILGMGMIIYALLVYPSLNKLLGHSYPSTPTFGVPCPTTIFTLGVLMLARGRGVEILFLVPILWAAIGGSATFLLGVWPDMGLLVSGSIAILWLVNRFRRARCPVP